MDSHSSLKPRPALHDRVSVHRVAVGAVASAYRRSVDSERPGSGVAGEEVVLAVAGPDEDAAMTALMRTLRLYEPEFVDVECECCA